MKRFVTTGEVRRLSALWTEGLSLDAMAKSAGISVDRVSHITRSNRERFPYRHPRRKAQFAEMVELRREGLSSTQIAARLGCAMDTVQRALREAGIIRPRVPRSSLPVDIIIARRKAGARVIDLAAEYGVGRTTIAEMVRGAA